MNLYGPITLFSFISCHWHSKELLSTIYLGTNLISTCNVFVITSLSNFDAQFLGDSGGSMVSMQNINSKNKSSNPADTNMISLIFARKTEINEKESGIGPFQKDFGRLLKCLKILFRGSAFLFHHFLP